MKDWQLDIGRVSLVFGFFWTAWLIGVSVTVDEWDVTITVGLPGIAATVAIRRDCEGEADVQPTH